MKELNKWQVAIQAVGAILVLVGSVVYITQWKGAFYLFATGVICFTSMQWMAGYDGCNLVVRRLRRQQLIGALCMLLSAVAMGMQTFRMGGTQSNEWIVCLTIAAVLELYTVFRIPAELEKESKH